MLLLFTICYNYFFLLVRAHGYGLREYPWSNTDPFICGKSGVNISYEVNCQNYEVKCHF